MKCQTATPGTPHLSLPVCALGRHEAATDAHQRQTELGKNASGVRERSGSAPQPCCFCTEEGRAGAPPLPVQRRRRTALDATSPAQSLPHVLRLTTHARHARGQCKLHTSKCSAHPTARTRLQGGLSRPHVPGSGRAAADTRVRAGVPATRAALILCSTGRRMRAGAEHSRLATHSHLRHGVDECDFPARPSDCKHHARETCARAHVNQPECLALAVRPHRVRNDRQEGQRVFHVALQNLRNQQSRRRDKLKLGVHTRTWEATARRGARLTSSRVAWLADTRFMLAFHSSSVAT